MLAAAELVTALDKAGEVTFEGLVQRQARFVFRVAFAVLRNADDSEDVVQETFLKLHRNGRWKGVEDERAFLARAAWRIAVDRRRHTKRDEAHDDQMSSGDESPEQLAMVAQRNALVHRLVDSLPEELRQPLALSTVEELNSREVAEILGIPEGTVRTRLMRARQMLKQKLMEVGK
jgi:RNA polymerase sigma-70 factor (ECF subfamily)